MLRVYGINLTVSTSHVELLTFPAVWLFSCSLVQMLTVYAIYLTVFSQSGSDADSLCYLPDCFLAVWFRCWQSMLSSVYLTIFSQSGSDADSLCYLPDCFLAVWFRFWQSMLSTWLFTCSLVQMLTVYAIYLTVFLQSGSDVDKLCSLFDWVGSNAGCPGLPGFLYTNKLYTGRKNLDRHCTLLEKAKTKI